MKIVVAAVLVAVPTMGRAKATDAPKTAQEVLTQAEGFATAEHRNVLVSFSASWCVNCRLYDRLLADKAMRPILGKAYVFVDLVTGERPGDKAHTNILGGQAAMSEMGGTNAGYPFIAVIGADGKLITNSLRPVGNMWENIGYPDAPDEIDWFMQMLQRSAPSLSKKDMTKVRSWLQAHSTTQR